MKTTRLNHWLTASAAVLATTTAFRAAADQPAAQAEESYTGTIVSVAPQDHTLNVKGWMMAHKVFNLGDNCIYTQSDNSHGTINDLRPGEKVTVNYRDAHGVLIADQVKQEPLQFEGMVKTIDPDKHTLTLHRQALDKELQIADDCKIVLRNETPGTFADIQPGNHVTVTYEIPRGTPTARLIAQTSMIFTGTLTAIDLDDRTVKAKALFNSKKFSLADNCAIVIHGTPDGHLSDLKPKDKLLFTYDEINGVNVVNRIAPAVEAPALPATAASKPQEQPQNLGMPIVPPF